MNAFVFLDVLGNFFGNRVVMSKNLAYYFLHYVGFKHVFIGIWGPNKYTDFRFGAILKVVRKTLYTTTPITVFY
jgi:hypothetical protein